jgi:hypothetical protein
MESMNKKEQIIELIKEDSWHNISVKNTVNKIFSILCVSKSLPTIIEIDFDGHLKCKIEITDKELVKGIDEAYKKAGSNAYFGNGFQAGVDFALKRVKNLTIPNVIMPTGNEGTVIHDLVGLCPSCGEELSRNGVFNNHNCKKV